MSHRSDEEATDEVAPVAEVVSANRRLVRAFWTIVLVSFVVLSFSFYELHDLRNVTSKNRALILRVDALTKSNEDQLAAFSKFRTARLKDTNQTNLIFCRQFNDLKRVIRSVVVPTRASLLLLPYFRSHPEDIAVTIANGKRIAAQFSPISCTNLPTVKDPTGTRPDKKGPSGPTGPVGPTGVAALLVS